MKNLSRKDRKEQGNNDSTTRCPSRSPIERLQDVHMHSLSDAAQHSTSDEK